MRGSSRGGPMGERARAVTTSSGSDRPGLHWRTIRSATTPLEGAHGATPCDRCHRKVAPAELSAPFRGGVEPVTLFSFSSTLCLDCHEDPHAGGLDRFADASGCSGCHAVAGWDLVTFDHTRTGSILEGAHVTVSCGGCHRKTDRGVDRLVWVGIDTGCTDCHRNPHGTSSIVPVFHSTAVVVTPSRAGKS